MYPLAALAGRCARRASRHLTANAGSPTYPNGALCHAHGSGVVGEFAMLVYVDEGFRPCVTECATVAFRVCCDDRAQIFEVSAEALVAFCGAASKRKRDLLVAFEDAQQEILSVAAQKWTFKPTERVRLGLDEFRMVRH
jgi:hypothetical protein